jgi:hypothetical protein
MWSLKKRNAAAVKACVELLINMLFLLQIFIDYNKIFRHRAKFTKLLGASPDWMKNYLQE